jgi:hypothetical protein
VFTVVHQKSWDTNLNIHILLLFTLLLLPLFDMLINIFVKEKKIFDSRMFFAWAIIIFCFVGFYLVFKQTDQAEEFSIYAYYLLIAGVVFQILGSIISSKKTS